MQTVLILVVFAGKRTADTVTVESYAATTAALAIPINEDDFMKADHGS